MPIDFSDFYDDDTSETRRMMHNCGFETRARRGVKFILKHWPICGLLELDILGYMRSK